METHGSDDVMGSTLHRQAGAQWIQEVLEEHYKKKVEQLHGGVMEGDSKESVAQVGVVKDGEDEGTEEAPTTHQPRPPTPPILELSILGYEVTRVKAPADAPPPTDTSHATLLILKVRYVVQHGAAMIEKKRVFHVKSPPEDKDVREIVEISHVNRNEINFYTQLMPYIHDWVKVKGVVLSFHVPHCYFGKSNRSLGKTIAKDIEQNFPYAESVLLLEDLGDRGFTRRDGSGGLTLDEVKASIHELAQLHALSWAMCQNEEEIEPLFKFGQKQLERAVLYEVLLNKGFKTLKAFVEGKCDEPEVILKRIGLMEAKLCGTLVALLEPSPPPSPTTLVHMNSWIRNLVFRPKPFEDVDLVAGKHRIKNSRLDCKLLNWEMFGRGRPTHDLAILILTSMSAKERIARTDQLLQYYFQVFKDTAGLFGHHLPFDMGCLKREFKESKLLALFFMIASMDLILAQGPIWEDRLLTVLQELINARIF